MKLDHITNCINVTNQTDELNHIIHVMSVVQCKYTLNLLNPSFVHSWVYILYTSNKHEQADDNKYVQINLIQEQKDKH